MVSELVAVQPQTRIAMPSGLLTPARKPPFAVHDQEGRRIDLRQRVGEPLDTVYISPFATGLRFFLDAHLAGILGDRKVTPTDRAWAAHRALLFAAGDVMHAGPAGIDLRTVLATARVVARFAIEVGPRALQQLNPQPIAAAHAVSTAAHALGLAVADGCTDLDWLAAVTVAGLTADLGKVDLAGAVDHPGVLTPDQWTTIRRHPQRSIEILRAGRGVVPASTQRAVLTHHERWDGMGYPGELFGDAIPYEGRVVAIAEAFAAITADRPNRPGAEIYEALTAMASTPGQFDPRLLRVFVLMLGTQAEDEPPVETSTPASASRERTSA